MVLFSLSVNTYKYTVTLKDTIEPFWKIIVGAIFLWFNLNFCSILDEKLKENCGFNSVFYLGLGNLPLSFYAIAKKNFLG